MARAIGIVRVSRARDEALSPAEQRERIEDTCRRDGHELIGVHEEIDVSGGTALSKRRGLSAAVEAVEAREADVLMVAYFDRLVRSLRVQDEVVSRVEAADGRVLALDFGQVTGKTAAQWLSGTMIGAVSEYYRRSVGERSGEAQAMAVARGVCPWPDVPPGYRKREDGILEPDAMAPTVREAWETRADGASIRDCRAFLAERGVDLSYSATQRMFTRPAYLGEIRFGKLINPSAHEPIISRELWARVQRTKVSRGRQPKSERLLARLGVLRCGGCGGAMGVSTSGDGRGGGVPAYRCPASTSGDCGVRASVGAEIAERVVVDAVRRTYADARGRASAERRARQAVETAERAQADLDSAIRSFAGVEDEPAAVERLTELRQVRDKARAHADSLGGDRAGVVVDIADWDGMPLDVRRAAIQAVGARATVGPGRGAGRIAVTFGE